jgi:K+-sensing histidine kinase KdpD
LAIIIIIVGALGLINGISYMRMQSSVESVLTYISENNGKVPNYSDLKDDSWLGDPNGSNDTPEFSYQTRYFTVRANTAGHVTEIDVQHIAAFTQEEAVKYAQMAIEKGEAKGFFKNNRASYGYMITKQGEDNYLIVIMDCTHDVAAVQSFMRASVWFGLICIILYMLILIPLCNVAIKPFVHNMENQKRFITNAGHELKTPIAIISANTEAMELINGKNQWTESILKQTQRLTNLISSLIFLSKIGENSRETMKLTSVNVSRTVTEAADSFQTMLANENKKLVNEIKPDVHATAEERWLYEIINILMDNAVKYCDDNGTVNVSVTTGKRNKGAIITITNDYADGANTDYTRFFERFYRGDESHNSKKSGYGIGLSMAAEIIKNMKGKLDVSYKNGRISFIVKMG